MNPNVNDVIVPKELINLFKNSIRIIDKKHLAGMWPVDARQLKKLQAVIPELFAEANIMNKYDIAITYQGKTMKNDFSKVGVDFIEDRIIKDLYIHGIPVPWQLLKKAGIDSKKFNVILTPKQQA
jgi:hypothetical protein